MRVADTLMVVLLLTTGVASAQERQLFGMICEDLIPADCPATASVLASVVQFRFAE